MFYIIQVEPLDGTHMHPYEGQTGRTACWLEGHIAVPQALVEAMRAHSASCELRIEDGILTDIVPVEPTGSTPPEEFITQEQALLLLLGGETE